MSKMKFRFLLFFLKMVVKITKNIFRFHRGTICAEDVCTCPTRLINWFSKYHDNQFEKRDFERNAFKAFHTDYIEKILFMLNQLRGHRGNILFPPKNVAEILFLPYNLTIAFLFLAKSIERRSSRVSDTSFIPRVCIHLRLLTIPITLIIFKIDIIYTNLIKFLTFFIHF